MAPLPKAIFKEDVVKVMKITLRGFQMRMSRINKIASLKCKVSACYKWVPSYKGWVTIVISDHDHQFFKISHCLRNEWRSNFVFHSVT